jgi:hypothetical protein
VKMAEILKGNADFVQGMSLQGVLESHITTFTRSCTPHRPNSEDAPEYIRLTRSYFRKLKL